MVWYIYGIFRRRRPGAVMLVAGVAMSYMAAVAAGVHGGEGEGACGER